jgi:hypothetical protein
MKRSDVSPLVIGLLAGLLIGTIAVIVVMNGMVPERRPSAPTAAVVPPVAAVTPAAPAKSAAPARAAHKPMLKRSQELEVKGQDPLSSTGKQGIWQQGSALLIQIGDGGIFSGVDPKDPRIYHFAE